MNNVNITATVGRGAANLRDDVIKVQILLNDFRPIPMTLIEVDGLCGPFTVGAIEDFQRRVMKLRQPDGLVSPQGTTMAALSPVELQRMAEVLVPYQPGFGLYVKESGGDGLHGTPATVESIKRLARKVAEKLQASVGITDMSLKQGGKYGKHRSHRRGIDVDIRPLRKDKRTDGVLIDNPAYSRELTQKMVDFLREDPNTALILFADKNIKGVVYESHHDNHLHVRFRN